MGTDDTEESTEPSETTFGLEYQLRDFIAQNIGAIPVSGKRLRLYVDQSGRDGIEYPTATGPIDILALDDTGAFVVFELKRARSPDRAMGQLTRYMASSLTHSLALPTERACEPSNRNARQGRPGGVRVAVRQTPAYACDRSTLPLPWPTRAAGNPRLRESQRDRAVRTRLSACA